MEVITTAFISVLVKKETRRWTFNVFWNIFLKKVKHLVNHLAQNKQIKISPDYHYFVNFMLKLLYSLAVIS